MSFHPDPYRLESPDEIQHGTSQLGGLTGPSVFGPDRRERVSDDASSTAHPDHARGPKSYNRTDLRIREDVCQRLLYAELDSNEVNVDVEDSIVKLTGVVEDRCTKRTLEAVAANTAGVRGVVNQIRVEQLPSSQMNLGTPYYSLVSSGTDPAASA